MNYALKILVNLARIIVGVTFCVSGFVKAIDPLGTQYKFHDYLESLDLVTLVPDILLLVASIVLSTFELTLGVVLLLAIFRKVATKFALVFMAVMTIITVWIYIANPVKDCGCFGDAFVLTNGQTLLKNVVLLACTLIMAWKPDSIKRLMNVGNQLLVIQCSVILSVAVSLWCLYDLPLIDFRPYSIGADIKKGMEIPEGAELPEFDTTFILEKDGVQKEFTLDNYPDSTWTFVDSKTVTIKEGYVPPIHDFSIVTQDGDDITEDVLNDRNYTFLLIAPYLENADDQNFGTIDMIYEYADDNDMKFYCLTASSEDGIVKWQDLTGAEYPFCQTDGTTLKTIVRSNPGLLLIKNGIVIGKWSHNRLPDLEELGLLTSKGKS